MKHAVQRTIEVLVHASQCKDCNCKNGSCIKMKQIIFHVRRCRVCPNCNQFLQLCLQHAKQCKDKECAVPLCANLKKRIEERQRESQINQNWLMQRRMRMMRSDSSPTITPSNTVAQSPSPSTPHPQQPNMPTLKAPSKNSPTPSPAIRNPGSVPTSISQPSPGGGKILNPNQEPMYGPQSVPGKLISTTITSSLPCMQQHPQTQQRQMGMQTIHRYPPPHQAPGGRYPQYNQGPGTVHPQPQPQHDDPTFNPGYSDPLPPN